MKVLWITNILFPEAEQLLSGSGELKASGGWMLGAAIALLQKEGIKLYVASVSHKVSSLVKLEGQKITYYVLPLGKGNLRVNLQYVPYWKQVQQEVQPDVVHIHGTEYSHGHAYMKACSSEKVVLSIQGLLHAIAPYYCAGISKKDILCNITFRDVLKGTILHDQKLFEKRAEYENEMICMAKHIIGRTSWDRARSWAINPNAAYHFCNETLRPEFYDGSVWDYNKCVKHSIFLSQAGYPIKGLHQVLKAMPIILRHYPDTKIRIAGTDITKSATWSEKLRLSGYGLYIKRLIKKYQLGDKVTFTGNLNADEMKQEYLQSNVFVCPSTIENSPNSLGEAQILGVPCVASYVGGIPDMMIGNEDYLYRYEEVEKLAYKICCLFASNQQKTDMKAISARRHNRIINSNILSKIYEKILNETIS